MEIPILQDYIEEGRFDILENFKPLFKKGSMYIRPDHKISLRTTMPYDSPWIHTKIDSGRICTFYSDILFPYLGIIHSRCFNCWKVVARPRTVSELFKCFEIQNKMGQSSKSGIEIRDNVEANYGQYWYNDSLEEGLECKQIVTDALPKGVPVFLKRGCTEYEQKLKDSSKWKYPEDQHEMERFIGDLVMIEYDPTIEWPWYVHLNSQRKWIRFAAARGDMTYKEKTGGIPINRQYRLYEEKDLEGEFANPMVVYQPDGFPNRDYKCQ